MKTKTIKLHENVPTIPCPEHITGEACRLWEQLAPELVARGTLTATTIPAFEVYCQAYADWREHAARVKEQGSVVKSPNGFAVQHPSVSLASRASETVRKFAKQFGFDGKHRTATENAEKPASTLGGFLAANRKA